MSKVEFKEFVKKNPNLISFVERGETNWQKLYELYDLYGESSDVWNKYLKNNTESTNNINNIGSGFKETITIDARWSVVFSILISLTLNAFFNDS